MNKSLHWQNQERQKRKMINVNEKNCSVYDKTAQVITLLSSLSSRTIFKPRQTQREHLAAYNEGRTVSLDKWHPRALKELADVITGLSEREGSGERRDGKDWRWSNEFQIFQHNRKGDLGVRTLVKFNAEPQQSPRMDDERGFVCVYWRKWWRPGPLLHSLKSELAPNNLVSIL